MPRELPPCVDHRTRACSSWDDGVRAGTATGQSSIPRARFLVIRKGTTGWEAKLCAACATRDGGQRIFDYGQD